MVDISWKPNKKRRTIKDNRFEITFGKWVVKHRWWLIIATILVVFATTSGSRFLTFNNDTRVFFDSPGDDLLHSVKDDDFLRLELAYHF